MKKKELKKGVVKMGSGLPVIHPHAAGIDIGDTMHVIALGDGEGGFEVKVTGAFTYELKEIVEYFKENGVTTVAMESTGVYWLPLYLMLEEAGIEPYLVNAKHVKNVTGRKKDDTDAIWLCKLHTCGLLQKSFQPDSEIRLLRTFTRQRKMLITKGSDEVRRMQKALELMNIKLHTVISDILGKSGMTIVKAILGGERDANILATLCDRRIKASKEEILHSLEGIWEDEYLFLLQQAVDGYEFRQKQIKECEEKIQAQLLKQVIIIQQGDLTGLEQQENLTQDSKREEETSKPKAKSKKSAKVAKPKKNQFNTPISSYLQIITGVDLTKIYGLSEVTILEFIAEVGTDMSKWAGPREFAAWLNLTPNTRITGGKIISSKMMKKKNKAGQCLKQAASSLANDKSPLGDYYRKMRSKLGGRGATVATAHKLAIIIYTLLSKKIEYNPQKQLDNQDKARQAKIKNLEKQIERLKKTA